MGCGALLRFQLKSSLFLFDHIDEACLVFDQQGYLKYFNQAAADSYRHKLGYMDSIEGMHYSNLVLDSLTFEEIQQLGPQAPQEKPHQVEVHYGTYCFFGQTLFAG